MNLKVLGEKTAHHHAAPGQCSQHARFPHSYLALLQLDVSIALPLIDLLLGGEGRGTVAPRELAEIEEQILENVVQIVLRALAARRCLLDCCCFLAVSLTMTSYRPRCGHSAESQATRLDNVYSDSDM